MTAFWLNFDCILSVFWLHIDCICISTVFWQHFDRILNVFWLHFDCIWLHLTAFDCILTDKDGKTGNCVTSSQLDFPLITLPSTGTLAPGKTLRISPRCTRSTGTVLSLVIVLCSFRVTNNASVAWSDINLDKASEVLALAICSNLIKITDSV